MASETYTTICPSCNKRKRSAAVNPDGLCDECRGPVRSGKAGRYHDLPDPCPNVPAGQNTCPACGTVVPNHAENCSYVQRMKANAPKPRPMSLHEMLERYGDRPETTSWGSK